MHVRELVELGALITARGNKFVQHATLLTQRHMEQYWLASRCRHDHWFQVMKAYEQATPLEQREHWPFVQTVFEEVLASELLSRTWAAVGCTFDQQHQTSDFEPFVRSVLIGHLDARNRVLQTLLSGQGIELENGIRLNRLRRQTERWTDMLLGYLAHDFEVDEFAFNPQVARDFAADLRDENRSPVGKHAWELTLQALRAAYRDNLSGRSPHEELNQRIAASVLACFHSDLFDSLGTFHSHWVLRLNQVTEDAQGLVDDLLRSEEVAASCFASGQ